MMASSPLISAVLGYLLNALWQVPLLFLAAWGAARVLRSAGPHIEHRVWVAALLLGVGLPACHFEVVAIWDWARSLLLAGNGGLEGRTQVVFGQVTVAKAGALQLSPGLLTVVLTAYTGSVVYFVARLAWGLRKTQAMRKSSIEWPQESARPLGLRGVSVAISPIISDPSTVGFGRGVVLLPPAFLESAEEQDLDAALAHECAHIARHDFAKNLLYQLISLPIAFHPALWLMRSRISGTREMVCDAMAADVVHGRESYARSLLRLASMLTHRMPVTNLHAIGMFDANQFERRIMNLTEKHVEMTGARRILIGAVCGVVALGACGTALALRVDVSVPEVQADSPSGQNDRIFKVGNGVSAPALTYAVDPEFPEAERKGKPFGFSGVCVVNVLIGKTGEVEQAKVVKGIETDFNAAAIAAVRQYKFKPSMRNGEPVAVSVEVEVNFKKY